ncbi:MAG: D-tyrosyl-tRNA(Tyr) deacylase [Provencibacterium sp.]|jgi:D-tyrosyl-tRNA(Tyr) deacylase|nr:D-tyrosyl-tRNA(Tyr) deacylase [Provencibacterium sp.]
MKAVLQRVRHARVEIEGETAAAIGKGLLILLGVTEGDTERECDLLCEKAAVLRIFEDGAGKMNRSVCDENGEVLVVSQFTLAADCRKGRRPSFTAAARPEEAKALYERFIRRMRETEGIRAVSSGVFGADMQVTLCNDGPVTILLDSDLLG